MALRQPHLLTRTISVDRQLQRTLSAMGARPDAAALALSTRLGPAWPTSGRRCGVGARIACGVDQACSAMGVGRCALGRCDDGDCSPSTEAVPAAAGVSRVGMWLGRIVCAVVCSTLGVGVTSVSDQDGLLLHGVASLATGAAGVHGMAVVEATADRIALDDLEAHVRDRRRCAGRERQR